MSATTDLFHYCCSTPVRAGDLVRFHELECQIEIVIEPDTPDADAFSCPETGGIMISIVDGQKLRPYALLTPPDREQWEDLEFIARQAKA